MCQSMHRISKIHTPVINIGNENLGKGASVVVYYVQSPPAMWGFYMKAGSRPICSPSYLDSC